MMEEEASEGSGGEKYPVPNFFRSLSGVHPDWAKCLEAAPVGSGQRRGGVTGRCECGRKGRYKIR